MASLDDLSPRNISSSNPTASQSAAQNLTPKDSISEAGITPIKDPAQSQEGDNLQTRKYYYFDRHRVFREIIYLWSSEIYRPRI